MKYIFSIIFIFAVFLFADDRLYNHGVCGVEFSRNDSTMYYLTWSSAHNNGWEHDIYHQVILFNDDGSMHTVLPAKRYIGTGGDEAQEPVHCAINKSNNVLLSVWEDGSGSEAPNVRGQLHKADGTILKENWIIAGGVGSQHSANTSHLEDSYIVLYADEAAPATKGAVVKAKVVDNSNGEEKQIIVFFPYDEDHWWPVSISNEKQTHTLVAWGNDGYALRGTVLHHSGDSITMVRNPRDYLVNTQQYFYQLEWLDAYNLFLMVARHGAYENLTDSSQICLVDTLGNISKKTVIAGGIEREAKMAIRFNRFDSTYSVLYPTGQKSLVHFIIDKDGPLYSLSDTTISTENTVDWVTTGIWSNLIKSVNGNSYVNDSVKLLFMQNDTASNDILLQTISFAPSFFGDQIPVLPSVNESFNEMTIEYRKGALHFPYKYRDGEYVVYDVSGKVLVTGKVLRSVNILQHLSQKVLFVRLEKSFLPIVCRRVVVK